MTFYKTVALLTIVIGFLTFSVMKSVSSKANNETVLYVAKNVAPNVVSPESTIIAFLKWYKYNEERLRQIQLLTGGLKDTTTFYSVNFKATEKYLSELKKSGFLSDRFLEDLRTHFIQANEYLKQHPQHDGPAPGFEADLIMKSQDYMDVFENLDNVKVLDKNMNGNKAYLKLMFAGYYKTKYYLAMHRNKWLIDKIQNAFLEN